MWSSATVAHLLQGLMRCVVRCCSAYIGCYSLAIPLWPRELDIFSLNIVWLLVPERLIWVFQKVFPTWPSLRFVKNDLTKSFKNHCSSSLMFGLSFSRSSWPYLYPAMHWVAAMWSSDYMLTLKSSWTGEIYNVAGEFITKCNNNVCSLVVFRLVWAHNWADVSWENDYKI